jgi:hypothetical protein
VITLIGGNIQGPNNLAVPFGSVVFQLNVDATVIAAPHGFVAAAVPVVFQFDSTGNLIQPAKLWSNEELQPQLSPTLLGTYYLVTFYTQAGAKINISPLWFQFPEISGSTVDIGNVTPISTIGGNLIFYPTNFSGGTGSVTSVTFTGDGTILSATPSAPVTTSGTLTATLLPQNANRVLAGPASGGAALPTFRALVAADLPASAPVSWSSLTAATAPLILANTTFGTTFNQTTPAAWVWANVTPATNVLAQSSPILTIRGQSWNGSTSVNNDFTIQNVPANGTNAGQTLVISSVLANGGITLPNTVANAINVTGLANFFSAVSLDSAGATNITNPNSPAFVLNSAWWDGSASHVSATTIQDVEGSGNNPTDTTTISNSGAFAWAGVSILGAIKSTTNTVTVATPTGAASTVSFGTTTATSATAGTNGDVPAQVVGYLVIDIAGTKFKVPYYAV